MTVLDFCKHKTKATEICVIRERGWRVATVWIDYEDIFMLPDKLIDKKVKSDEWGTIQICDMNNYKTEIPCHYIDVY